MDFSLVIGDTEYPAVRGDLMIPRSGLWTSDTLLGDTESPPAQGDVVTLRTYDRDRVGIVTDVGTEYGQIRLRIVGGKVDLSTVIESRSYADYALSDIAADIVGDAGGLVDTLAGLEPTAPYWVRARGTAASALRRVLGARATPAGGSDGVRLRLFAEDDGRLSTAIWSPTTLTTPDAQNVASTYTTLAVWPQDREAYIGPDLTTSIEPGNTIVIYDRQVAVVRAVYRFEPEDLRCQVWWEELG